jgi:flagellin
MALTILNNIAALAAENQLNVTSANLNNTLQQLSTGSRINTGADDPAGLSIANGLEANISALTQSVSNANDGVGQLQLADGALAQVSNLLNTAVTLATESATGTVSNSQRVAIQSQYSSILAEINRIGTATTYNSQAVFQGGVTTNLNAVDSTNSAANAPLSLYTPLTVGSTTSVSSNGLTFSYTAAYQAGTSPNTVTGGGTGLTTASPLASGTVVTATRATGTTTYTAGAATTVADLMAAINTGASTTGGTGHITVGGTDLAHTGYTSNLVSGSLQITDLNNNNDLAVTEVGGAIANQVATTGQNYTTGTNLVASSVLTINRTTSTPTSLSATYTVGSLGATMAQMLAAITTGTTQSTGTNQGVTVVEAGLGTAADTANLTATLVNGNLQVADGNTTDTAFTAVQTNGTNPNLVQSINAGLSNATALTAGDVFTAARGGQTTTYTVGTGGAIMSQLIAAISTGVSTGTTPATYGITVDGGSPGTGLAAALVGAHLQVQDLNNNGNLAFTESGATIANSQVTTVAAAGANAGAATLASGDTFTLTRGTGITTYLTTGATTVAVLLSAINAGVTTGLVTVTKTTDTATGGYTASYATDATNTGLVGTAGAQSQLQIVNNNSGAVTFAQTVGADFMAAAGGTTAVAAHAVATLGVNTNDVGAAADQGQQLTLAANAAPTLGTFTTNTTTAPTVQNLINAINGAGDTIGAHASLTTAGLLEIIDPLDRNNLTATTTDTVLGAPVEGAPTALVNPTTTSTATNLNQLVGSAVVTQTTGLTNGDVTNFTAGGKSFSFTAGPTSTVSNLLNAINSPTTDTAGLSAYLNSAGKMVVTDTDNGDDLAVGSTSNETALGAYSNPLTTTSEATNIFLSDSTAIGSSQIAVTIGGLTTTGIVNGSGNNSIDLATTDLSFQTDAQTALTQINQAIENVASTRGTLGASVNRLTAASNVINSQVQNLTSAENTITAADIPSAVADLTKYSILEQTGISALAQANQQQQLVLKLLT